MGNYIDNQNIERMAELWLELGCDSSGFVFVQGKILSRIEEIELFEQAEIDSKSC